MIRKKVETDRYTLICGDCRDVLPSLAADAVVTDPPFGIFCHGGKWGKKFSLEWDRPEKKPDVGFLLGIGKKQIIWGGNYFPLPPSRGWLVWYKRDSVRTTADCELAWTSMDMNTRLIDQTIAATNPERCGHPTQKPLRVMVWSLSFVPDADVVCDPFMGSGTTGVAAMKLGKIFVGVEKEEKYFDIAVERIKKAAETPPLFEIAEKAEQGHLFE